MHLDVRFRMHCVIIYATSPALLIVQILKAAVSLQSAKRRGATVTVEKGVHDERLAQAAAESDKKATTSAIEQDLDNAKSKVNTGADKANQAAKDTAQDAKSVGQEQGQKIKQAGNQALDKVAPSFPA